MKQDTCVRHSQVRVCCVAVAFVVMVMCCSAARTNPSRLLPYYTSQKLWGYIDTTGRVVLEPQFASASRFSEGLASVELPDRSCGYINEIGQMVVGPTRAWGEGGPFSEGRAVVWSDDLSLYPFSSGGDRMWDGPAQYIDYSGKFITDRWYESCGDFSEGIGCARDSTGTTCIDRSGKVLFRVRGRVSGFSEGLAAVSFRDRSKDGSQHWYVDRKGRVVIPPRQGLTSSPFHEGLAFVIVRDTPPAHPRYAYIDRHGQLAFSTEYSPFYFGGYRADFSDGMALLRIDSLYGYVDHTGRPVIEPRWRAARPFSEGLAPALGDSAGDTRWGYIDRSGRWVIQPRFAYADEFRDGFARVELKGRAFGYVNKQGKLLGIHSPP